MGEVKVFNTKPEPYCYGFSFTADRKLTHEEIMSISRRGAEAMIEIVLQETGQDPDKHNSSSGVENR